MNQDKSIAYVGAIMPVSPLLKVERKSKYGSVPGLDDEELAGPDELERQVRWEDWGSVLFLPAPKYQVSIRPEIDEDGHLCGAFASVDFDRITPAFDKVHYKIERLRDEHETVLIMFDVLRQHLPKKPVAVVLKKLQMGLIELDDISDMETWHLGRLFLRAWRLKQEIVRLDEYSERQRQKKAEAFFASMG